MKIEINLEIEQFFNRCMNHLLNENKNDFLGMKVTKENQIKLQQKMKKAGFQEFQGSSESWPSLFISTEEFLKSPYHSTIDLERIEDEEFSFSKEIMNANELFNVSSIHPDMNRELNDWMTLRALDQPYEAVFLWQGNDVWMLDAPSEANTNDPYAIKAQGHVVTFGLGIGYFIYMAMRNPLVETITVVEKSASVISMFTKFILPQFPTHVPLKIIKGDAFDYFNASFINQYDYAYVDIWQSNDDGFDLIEKLLQQYLPEVGKVDFWIESSCFEFMPALIFLYFNSIAHKRQVKHENPNYNRLLKKIAHYFNTIDRTVTDVNELKNYMYDQEILRSITAIKG